MRAKTSEDCSGQHSKCNIIGKQRCKRQRKPQPGHADEGVRFLPQKYLKSTAVLKANNTHRQRPFPWQRTPAAMRGGGVAARAILSQPGGVPRAHMRVLHPLHHPLLLQLLLPLKTSPRQAQDKPKRAAAKRTTSESWRSCGRSPLFICGHNVRQNAVCQVFGSTVLTFAPPPRA
jgi:hypothetical protein